MLPNTGQVSGVYQPSHKVNPEALDGLFPGEPDFEANCLNNQLCEHIKDAVTTLMGQRDLRSTNIGEVRQAVELALALPLGCLAVRRELVCDLMQDCLEEIALGARSKGKKKKKKKRHGSCFATKPSA